MGIITIITAALSGLFLIGLFHKFGRMKGSAGSNQSPLEVAGADSLGAEAVSLVREETHDEPDEFHRLRQKFPDFSASGFSVQADKLFDSIFSAFASSELDTLKSSLSPALYRSFIEQIQKREKKNLKQEITIKHTKTTMDNVQILVTKAKLFVSFYVSQMSAIINSDGVSMDNPNKLCRNVLHKWIFERKYTDNDWILTKTSCAEI
ncbi:MAG: TIM44-like domain-containing protein [Holosporales bacterium]|jgi:predicted lipid-binding transport protein (Tim44 family)|nr:TIM44-like domain-containing protein [Holosporales bacterium]